MVGQLCVFIPIPVPFKCKPAGEVFFVQLFLFVCFTLNRTKIRRKLNSFMPYPTNYALLLSTRDFPISEWGWTKTKESYKLQCSIAWEGIELSSYLWHTSFSGKEKTSSVFTTLRKTAEIEAIESFLFNKLETTSLVTHERFVVCLLSRKSEITACLIYFYFFELGWLPMEEQDIE